MFSDLPSLLDTSLFLKYSAKFYIPKTSGKHGLLSVSEKSDFCSTLSNTFHKWPVVQGSVNVFYNSLYGHNVV